MTPQSYGDERWTKDRAEDMHDSLAEMRASDLGIKHDDAKTHFSVEPYSEKETWEEARDRIRPQNYRMSSKKQAPVADESRTIASMRLARLQIDAGLAEESDDLSLGQKIASSERTDSEINQTIKTLESVKKAASKKQARPAHLVPRTASAGSRSTPSFAGGSGSDPSVPPSLSVEATKDTEDADLFL